MIGHHATKPAEKVCVFIEKFKAFQESNFTQTNIFQDLLVPCFFNKNLQNWIFGVWFNFKILIF
jgi:hypothetical protein